MIDPLGLMPESLKNRMFDSIIEFISEQANRLLGEGVSNKFSKLKTDSEFQTNFKDGIVRAVERFGREFEDHELAALINQSESWINNKVQIALLNIIKHPVSWSQADKIVISQQLGHLLPDSMESQKLDTALSFFIKCLIEEIWHLPELAPIYELQLEKASLRFDEKKVNQLIQMVNEIQGLRSDLRGALAAFIKIASRSELLLEEVNEKPKPNNVVISNLRNPTYTKFIGREEEIKILKENLSPDERSWLTIIKGVGGVGKSTLAMKIAHHYIEKFFEIPEKERFNVVIWISAKTVELDVEGIISLSDNDRTLQEILKKIAIEIKEENLIHGDIDEQVARINLALTKPNRRSLLIIDNMETIDDKKVRQFLEKLRPPTKCIITSRERTLNKADIIELQGLSRNEGLELINTETKKREIILDEKQSESLLNFTWRIPLAIVWSIAQIEYGFNIKDVLFRLGDYTENDIVRYIFNSTLEKIHKQEMIVIFWLLALFNTNVSREALLSVATSIREKVNKDDITISHKVYGDLTALIKDLTRQSIIKGLVELERLSLVNRTEQYRYSMLSITKSYALNEINENVPYFTDITRWAQMEWFKNVTFKLKHQRFEDGLQEADLDNILDLISWYQEVNDCKSIIYLVKHTMQFFDHFRNYWKDREVYLDIALNCANIDDIESQVFIYIQQTWLYSVQGRLEEAIAVGKRAINLSKKLDDGNIENSRLKITGHLYLGDVFLDIFKRVQANKADQALSHFMIATGVAERVNDNRSRTLTNYYLGKYYVALGDIPSALSHYEASLSLAQEDNWDRMVIHTQIKLAEAFLYTQDIEKAEEACLIASKLNKDSDSGNDWWQAKINLNLAQALKFRNDIGSLLRGRDLANKAIHYLTNWKLDTQEAESIFSELGEKIAKSMENEIGL